MEKPGLTAENPPTATENEREEKFEKESTDPNRSSLFHLNSYTKYFLGGLLLLALILVYVTHL